VKVAANEVEQLVILAQTEVEQNTSESRSSLDSLIEAFKRAAKLRDTPMYAAIVRGTNDFVARTVIVTTQEKHEGGAERRLCLVPYTETEELNRRRTRPEYLQTRTEGLRALLPTYYHEQWIRKDRLAMT
jgi:hypothetical protein